MKLLNLFIWIICCMIVFSMFGFALAQDDEDSHNIVRVHSGSQVSVHGSEHQSDVGVIGKVSTNTAESSNVNSVSVGSEQSGHSSTEDNGSSVVISDANSSNVNSSDGYGSTTHENNDWDFRNNFNENVTQNVSMNTSDTHVTLSNGQLTLETSNVNLVLKILNWLGLI